MSLNEGPTDVSDGTSKSSLSDTIFLTMGIPEIHAARKFRGVILQDLLTALLQAGILTKGQLAATIDRAEKEANELADEFSSEPSTKDQLIASDRIRKVATDSAQFMRDMFLKE